MSTEPATLSLFEALSGFWVDVGFIRWPLGFSLLAVVVLSMVSAVRLMENGAEASPVTKTWLDSILFWGGFAAISGVLGSLVGIIIAFQSIEMAGAAEATLVAGGIKVALLSSSFGVLTLGFAALSWFVLQLRWRAIAAKEYDQG